MAIRNDLTITWNASPRIITVDAPSVEVSCQDLLDSLRFLEAEASAMDDKVIVDAAGGENLGAGTSVGLTVTLQNALIGFEARLGPTYEQCRVNGGNVVALQSDLATYFATPINPTAFTQVVRTASSSATTTSQAQLEFSTFNGGVTIDPVTGSPGTGFPVGTPGTPSNNLADTLAIAQERGLSDIFVHSSVTLDSGDWSAGYRFRAVSPITTVITVTGGADITNCEIWDAMVEGEVADGNIFRECLVLDVTSFDGFFYRCGLVGTVALGGVTQTTLVDCFSNIAGADAPTIDVGSGSALAVRGYNGGLELTNKTGTDECSIDMQSGQLVVASTCTNGAVTVRGNAVLHDYSNGATVTEELLNVGAIAERVWRGIKLRQ